MATFRITYRNEIYIEADSEEEAIGNNYLNEESQVSFPDPSIKRYFNSIARTSKV